MLVVTAIGTYDGLGNAATTTYTYSGGQQFLAQGVRDRKFSGFALDRDASRQHRQNLFRPRRRHQYSARRTSHRLRADQPPIPKRHPRPLRQSDPIQLLSLGQHRAHRGGYFVNLGRKIEQDYAADNTHRDKATEYLYSTTTDDLLTQIDYGEVIGSSDGTFSDIGTDLRSTNIRYAASSSVNMSVPIEKSTLTSASVKVLVIGGGGGGGAGYTGNAGGAGGGAGGYAYDAAHVITAQNYSVVVGNRRQRRRLLGRSRAKRRQFLIRYTRYPRWRRWRVIDCQSKRQKRRLGRRGRI